MVMRYHQCRNALNVNIIKSSALNRMVGEQMTVITKFKSDFGIPRMLGTRVERLPLDNDGTGTTTHRHCDDDDADMGACGWKWGRLRVLKSAAVLTASVGLQTKSELHLIWGMRLY